MASSRPLSCANWAWSRVSPFLTPMCMRSPLVEAQPTVGHALHGPPKLDARQPLTPLAEVTSWRSGDAREVRQSPPALTLRHHQLGRMARSRRPDVCDQVGDRDVDFVSDGADGRNAARGNRTASPSSLKAMRSSDFPLLGQR